MNNCIFLENGLCYAKACYNTQECAAKDEDGNPKYAEGGRAE